MPRLFALVEERDDQSDFPILAWELQFGDHAWVVGYDGTMGGSFSSAERACWLFAHMGTAIRIGWYPRPGNHHPHRPRRRLVR
ncbi:hypothetical protein [Frankia sp. Cas4]|uniref:hypothetical protein n=1 Tax=Frankia sp. Cas4 TaxID=3073927 RepID=UPI002AD41930|nr:hypothetical protein [Frankia sp. Cas4]